MRIICWLLRKHKWRRLRKAEKAECTGFPSQSRICDRCGIRRAVKARKP